MARQARERLVDSARSLFATEGIRAVSVEQLLDASGVGRASFYRHFESKDDLVVAVLDDGNARWRAQLRDDVPARGQGVLGVFDVLAERFAEADYRGCLTLTALVEFRDPEDPIHRAAAAHQETTAADLTDLLGPEVPAAHRERAGRQLLQLVDSAILTALHVPGTRPATDAREAAEALIAHLGATS